MTIKKANIDYIEQLVDLIYQNKLAQSNYNGFLPRKDNYKDALRGEILQNLNKDTYAYFLAMSEKGLPIGVITANTYNREGIMGKLGVLTNLFVVENFRNNGTAKELALAAVNWSRESGVTVLEIDVFIENDPAQKFWDKLGFENILTIKCLKL